MYNINDSKPRTKATRITEYVQCRLALNLLQVLNNIKLLQNKDYINERKHINGPRIM